MSWLGLPKTLRVGITEPLTALDPRIAVGASTLLVLGQIFETAASVLEPLRAEDEDGLLFSAAVRPEVRFSDGTLLTAEIAACSLRNVSFLAKRATINPHGNRVWFRLASRTPGFARMLAHAGAAIVLDRASQLRGTGPFMFDHRPDARMLHATRDIRLVRNPYYHGITAIQEIRFALLPADDLVHALRLEWIDLTTALDPSAMPPGSPVVPLLQPGNSTALLFFNTQRRPTSDANVRRGIAAALDRYEIASASSSAFVAGSVLPPSFDATSAPPNRDLAEARRLLAGVHERLSLLVPPAAKPFLTKPSEAAHAIQRQLAEAGVAVAVLESRNDDEYAAALENRTYDLALGGCVATSPDPADFYDALFALFGCAATDEVPFTPLVYGHAAVLHAQHLHEVTIAADGFLPLANVTL